MRLYSNRRSQARAVRTRFRHVLHGMLLPLTILCVALRSRRVMSQPAATTSSPPGPLATERRFRKSNVLSDLVVARSHIFIVSSEPTVNTTGHPPSVPDDNSRT